MGHNRSWPALYEDEASLRLRTSLRKTTHSEGQNPEDDMLNPMSAVHAREKKSGL